MDQLNTSVSMDTGKVKCVCTFMYSVVHHHHLHHTRPYEGVLFSFVVDCPFPGCEMRLISGCDYLT